MRGLWRWILAGADELVARELWKGAVGGGEGWLEAICPEPSASLYGGGSADFGAAPVEAELGPERVFVA